jgi:hypothetical protein
MEVLKEFKEVLLKEKELLINFPAGRVEELKELLKRKEELLEEIKKLGKEELLPHRETLKEIDSLQQEVKALVVSNLSFIEKVFRELSGKGETYTPKGY